MLSALIGGVLIGLAATWLWVANGRVAGVSGLLRAALLVGGGGRPGDRTAVAFLAGLLSAGVIAGLAHHLTAATAATAALAAQRSDDGQLLPVLLLAGGLVGFGTRVGGGCTSGHGVCGLSRMSRRSLVATLTFMGLGAATVWLIAHGAPSSMSAWGVR